MVAHRSRSTILAASGGAVAVITAVILVLLIAFVALGVEVVSLLFVSRHMHSAADAAVLAAATAKATGANAANQLNEAQSVAGDATFVNGLNGTVVTLGPPDANSNYYGVANALQVKISQPQPVTLIPALYSGTFTVTASAVAAPANFGACVVALDGTDSGSFQMKGTADARLQGCDLYVNSSSSSAVSMAGSATLAAQNVLTVGGVSGSSQINAKITTGIASPAPDPYAGYTWPAPSPAACNNNFPSSGTVPSGHYCTVSINAGQTVTLHGIYWFDNLTVNGGGTVNGTDTVIILTNTPGNGAVKINGGALLNVAAPTANEYGNCCAGVAFYSASRTGPATFIGTSSQQITGALYFPNEPVIFNGGSAATQCTQIVAWQVEMRGTSSLTLNCAGTGVIPVDPVYKLVE